VELVARTVFSEMEYGVGEITAAPHARGDRQLHWSFWGGDRTCALPLTFRVIVSVNAKPRNTNSRVKRVAIEISFGIEKPELHRKPELLSILLAWSRQTYEREWMLV
jgi:hypothetical protein